MNYGELKSALADYLHRTDLTSEIITFVTKAEQRIGRDVRIRENNVQATVTPSSGVAALPTRYASLRRISTGSGTTLRILQAITPDEATTFGTSGDACVYYISDAIYLFPPSDTDIDVDYYEYPEPTAGELDSVTRPILDRYEDLYIAAAMVEASLFLKDWEAYSVWQGRYTDTVRLANKSAAWADRPRANAGYRLRGRLVQAS